MAPARRTVKTPAGTDWKRTGKRGVVVTDRVATVRFYVGLKRLRRSPPWPTDTLPVDAIVTGLQALTRGAGGTELLAHQDGQLVGRVRTVTEHYAHLVFYRVRKSGYPETFDDTTGDVAVLNLDSNKSLAEPTEMLFFQSGVIGHLVNLHGPGAASSARYIEEKTGIDLVMAALLREDVLGQIRSDDEVSQVVIRVASSNVEQLGKAAANMVDAGLSASTSPGTGSIELVYRAERGQKDRFWSTWYPRVRRLVQTADPGTLERAVVVRRDDLGRDDAVDFLTARITEQVLVVIDEQTRNVVPRTAESAIASAYNADRAAIEEAVSLVLAANVGNEADL
jgi:hypothetical protein